VTSAETSACDLAWLAATFVAVHRSSADGRRRRPRRGRCFLLRKSPASCPPCRRPLLLTFHDAGTDTDTDSPNACVGRKIVAVFGESVSVSASWNASLSRQRAPSNQQPSSSRSAVAAARLCSVARSKKSRCWQYFVTRRRLPCWPGAVLKGSGEATAPRQRSALHVPQTKFLLSVIANLW